MIFKNICLIPIHSQSVGAKHINLLYNIIQVKNISDYIWLYIYFETLNALFLQEAMKTQPT